MKKKVTTTEFYNYLNSLGLFRIAITENETAFYATIQDTPKLENFSVITKPDEKNPFWEVILSKNDIYNEKITKGFFN